MRRSSQQLFWWRNPNKVLERSKMVDLRRQANRPRVRRSSRIPLKVILMFFVKGNCSFLNLSEAIHLLFLHLSSEKGLRLFAVKATAAV